MYNQIFQIIYSRSTGVNLFCLALVFGLFVTWVMPWAGAELMVFSEGTKPLDLRFFYSADEAYALMKDLGGQGRQFYTMVELSADLFYPLSYTLLLCCLIVYLGKQVPFRRVTSRSLLLLPLLTLLLDYAENACIISLLIHYPYRQEGLALAGTFFTGLKWLFLFASTGTVLFAAAAVVRARFFSSPKVKANQVEVPPLA